MSTKEIDKKVIESLLPHREPMLLIDKLINIIPLKSATAIMYVKKTGFYVQGHFPNQPVMPGVLIVEAFGQAAAALTAHGINPKEYENKLVYLMSVDKARFRNPVIPDCELHLEIEAVRSHGRVWKYKGTAKVDGKRMADAEWSATIVFPPPPFVPGFIVTYSLIILFSPINTLFDSPLNFKSCGIVPILANGKIFVPFPILVFPSM